REKIAMVEHVDPDLAFSENFRGESFLQDLPRSDRRDNKTSFFEKILKRFPRQLERIFEPLDNSFLFEKGKIGWTALQGLIEQRVRFFEVLKTLFPADVRHHGHRVKFTRIAPYIKRQDERGLCRRL